MPLGVALSELRYELRAEIYSSLLPAHGLSAVDMQNVILERTQRELWNPTPGRTSTTASTSTCRPTPNLSTLTRRCRSRTCSACGATTIRTNQQPWLPLRYGFEDWINETLHLVPADPLAQRRHRRRDSAASPILTGQAQIWPIPTQLSHMRWMARRRSIRSRSTATQCMIDSTAIVLTCAAELLGAQKSEMASLKGNKAQAYIRRLIGRSGANKRDISAMGQGRDGAADLLQRLDAVHRLHSGP